MLKLILTGLFIGTAAVSAFGVGVAVVMGPMIWAMDAGSVVGAAAGFAWAMIAMIALAYVLAIKVPLSNSWMQPPPPPWPPD